MPIRSKVILCILVLVAFVQHKALFSQNESATPTLGIRLGGVLSTVMGDEAIDPFTNKFGLQFGLSGAFYFHPMLSLRSELNYELKGGKFSNHDMKMNLHYLSVPLYLKFNFTEDPEIYIYLGGYASYLLAAKTVGTYEIFIGNDQIVENISEDIYPNLNKFDLGILGGIGAQSRFNRWLDLFVDLRFTRGFVNLDNGKADLRYNFNYDNFWPEKNVDNTFNKAYMLTTGFIFYLDPR